MPKGVQEVHSQDPSPGGAPVCADAPHAGKLIRTIGQARATAAMTMMAACYNINRLAKFLDDGVDVFYKHKGMPSKTEVRQQRAGA